MENLKRGYGTILKQGIQTRDTYLFSVRKITATMESTKMVNFTIHNIHSLDNSETGMAILDLPVEPELRPCFKDVEYHININNMLNRTTGTSL